LHSKSSDQRHKVRGFLTYDLGTRIGHFNFGLIERYDSGTPFSAAAAIPITASMMCSNGATSNLSSTDSTKICTDATHLTPGSPIYPDGSARNITHQYAPNGAASGVGPTTVTYFFGGRGAYHWNAVAATDIALNYEFPIHNFAFFAKAEVRNTFNHLAVVGGQTQVIILSAFNPFTTTPVECTKGATTCPANANYQLNPNFGKAVGTATTFSQNGNYQLPRTYLYAIGARF